MANDKFIRSLSKGGVCLLFFCTSNCVFAEINKLSPTLTPQDQFILGLELMQSGRSDEAAKVFEGLYKKTNSTRVKLEWARAAFISHEYDESNSLFDEVLAQDIPESVRFNIGLFKAELSKFISSNDYGFGLVKDTNPFFLSEPQEIYIYGLPFNFEPPIKKETLYGMSFYFNRSMPILNKKNFRAIGGLNLTQYEGAKNNKYTLHAAFDYRLEKFKSISFRVGLDNHYQRDIRVTDQSYVNFQHRVDFPGERIKSLQTDIRIAKNSYPISSESNSRSESISLMASKNISATTHLGGSVFLESNKTKYTSLSFKTYSASVFIKEYLPLASSSIQLNLLAANRLYSGTDELFMTKRTDSRRIVSLALNRNKRVLELYPTIEAGIEKFTSNIPINSYRKNFINFYLKKTFN